MSLGLNITDWGAGFVKYLPGFIELEHKPKSLLRNLGIGKMTVKGTDVRQKALVQNNTGVGYTDKEGALPVPGAQKFIDMAYGRRAIAGSARLTDYTMAQSDKGATTVEDAMDGVLRSTMESVRWVEEFFLPRDGTGTVATLGATVSGATITVSDGRGFIRDGNYTILDSTGTITRGTFTVASKLTYVTTAGEATITPTAAIPASWGTTTGDLIVWNLGGTGSNTSQGKCVTGFQALFADSTSTTFEGVNTATYPEFTSLVWSNGGTKQNMTFTVIRKALAAAAQRIATGSVDNLVVWTSNWDALNFEELGQGELRVTTTDMIGGRVVNKYQSTFGNFALLTHPLSVYGEMNLVERSSVELQMVKEIDWRPATDAGGIFTRSNDNASYVASLIGFYDLVVYQRHWNSRITNLVVNPLLAW